MKKSKIQLSLLNQALIALAIMLFTVVFVAILVFSNNWRLMKQADRILNHDMPITINTLEMIDEVNDIYVSLLAYVNGDMSAKATYYKHLIEYGNYRGNVIIVDADNKADFIQNKTSILESESKSDQLEFIDRYFETFRQDVENHVFALYDPEINRMRQNRSARLQTEVTRYILNPLLGKNSQISFDEDFKDLTRSALALYETLLKDPSEEFDLQETYFTNLQFIQTKSTSFCVNNISLNCDNFTRKLNELKELGEVYFQDNFDVSQKETIDRVNSFKSAYIAPLQAGLENLSFISNQNIQHDITILERILQQMQVAIGFGAIICIVFICVLFVLIWFRILKPLSHVSVILGKLGNREYNIDLPEKSDLHEVGVIYSGLQSLRLSLIELQALRENQMREAEAKHNSEIQDAYMALKKSENSLRIYSKKLEIANQDLEQFIHIASHDLREPLKNILGLVQMVRFAQDKPDFPVEEKIEKIQSNIRRMENLIDDLRALTKLQSLDEAPSNINLKSLLEESFDEVSKNTANRKIDMVMDKLPQIEGYERYLKIAMSQIFSNALQYGAADLKIKVTAQKQKNLVRLSISNTLDAPLEISQNLILPFKRGANANHESSGVGLAVVRKIVEDLHQGRIMIDDQKSEVFTITLQLPLKQS